MLKNAERFTVDYIALEAAILLWYLGKNKGRCNFKDPFPKNQMTERIKHRWGIN